VYLARLRLAMVDEQDSVGMGCFLDLVCFGLGAVAGMEHGEGGVEGGCGCLGFEERERRMERERNRFNPVRFTGGSSDGMGGMGICAYAIDLGVVGGFEMGGTGTVD
jgi:hypothetical protein